MINFYIRLKIVYSIMQLYMHMYLYFNMQSYYLRIIYVHFLMCIVLYCVYKHKIHVYVVVRVSVYVFICNCYSTLYHQSVVTSVFLNTSLLHVLSALMHITFFFSKQVTVSSEHVEVASFYLPLLKKLYHASKNILKL